MSVRLYVKLPKAEIEKEGLEKMFSEFEPSFTTKLIKERKKKECRGFGFVTVPTDEAAEEFISKYNEKPLIYNGEVFKDEEGKEFLLLIEKALPRTKGAKEENGEEEGEVITETAESETPKKETPEIILADKNNKPQPQQRTEKKAKKNRKAQSKGKTPKTVSVSESIQPDPRWANELNKLKEMFTAQTTNS